MTPAEFMDFADELGTQPKCIDVALVPHWRDALNAVFSQKVLFPTNDAPWTSDPHILVHGRNGVLYIAYDPKMKPGEFAFRY